MPVDSLLCVIHCPNCLWCPFNHPRNHPRVASLSTVDGNSGKTEGDSSIQCVPTAVTGEILKSNSNSITIKVTSVDKSLPKLAIVPYRYETKKSIEALSNANTEVPVSTLTGAAGYTIINGIDPGTRYLFEFRSPDEGGGVLGAVEGWSTCECQGDNDAVSEFVSTQQSGYVTFSFRDNSQCEEGFALSRKATDGDDSDAVAFASTYYYSPQKPCSEVIDPKRSALVDDLAVSNLVVGKEYNYCARAVGSGKSGVRYSSGEECIRHKIAWEASIDGVVTLDSSAGSLPVANVTVEYFLVAADATTIKFGRATSNKSGKFQIAFHENHASLNNDAEVEVSSFRFDYNRFWYNLTPVSIAMVFSD